MKTECHRLSPDKQTSHATNGAFPRIHEWRRRATLSLQLRRARATKLVGGNQHSGQAASCGRVQRTPGVLFSWKAAAAKAQRPLLALLRALLLRAVNVLHRLVDRLQVLRVPELQLRVRDVVGAGKLGEIAADIGV